MPPDDPFGSADEPPRREHEAAASPFLVAPDEEPPPAPRRRLAVPLGALAAALVVVALVVWGVRPRSATVPLAGGPAGRALEPLEPRADPRTGERVAPFSGFAVSVDTDPAGAVVSIGGVPRGEAPVLANLDCSPGDRVEIAAEKRGFAPARASTLCRRDALVKLTVRLRR